MRDLIGILLSIFCIFHCLGLPFLLPLLTEMGGGFDHELIHLGLLVIVSLYTAFFLWPPTSTQIRLISGTGLIILYGAMLFHGEVGETVLTVGGSLALMMAHILDMRLVMAEERASVVEGEI